MSLCEILKLQGNLQLKILKQLVEIKTKNMVENTLVILLLKGKLVEVIQRPKTARLESQQEDKSLNSHLKRELGRNSKFSFFV